MFGLYGGITITGLLVNHVKILHFWKVVIAITTVMIAQYPATAQLCCGGSGGAQSGGYLSGGDEMFRPESLLLDIHVLLEGPHSTLYRDAATDETSTNKAILPTRDPYFGTVSIAAIPPGVTDWLLLELRTRPDTASMHKQLAFLRNDGTVVDLHGHSPVPMDIHKVRPGAYYLIIRHRNHLDVMSAQPVPLFPAKVATYDFRKAADIAYSDFQTPLLERDGRYYMFAGDVASTPEKIDARDAVFVFNNFGKLGYHTADITLDGRVDASDLVLVLRNAFRVTQIP